MQHPDECVRADKKLRQLLIISMWMLRLLPGMGPETKKPDEYNTTKREKIILRPSAALPPANVNAKQIANKFTSQIREMHKMCGGRLDLIHMMFCQIAEHNGKPPIPPQSMLLLLELTPEDCKEHPVIVSDVALEKAFAKMIKPEDNADVFYTKVISVVEQQVARSKHATVEIEKLRPAFKELHEACGGCSKALFAFFMELLPEEQRGQYALPMWVSMVMKLPPQTTHIELDHFTDCFAQAMDSTDTAESILPKVRKHVELNQDPKAAAAKAAEIDRQAKEIAEREK